MDFSSMARIGADGASLAMTALAVHATHSPTIDALVNAVSGGRVNSSTLCQQLLDDIMRFVGDHVPLLANLDDDEGRLLRNAILLTTSPDQNTVQRAADGIVADAVTAPSQAMLANAHAAIEAALGDLPVKQAIQDHITSTVSAFRENVESRLKAHMTVGENLQASQKMLKATVDTHGWVAIDTLTATLVGTATNGNALAESVAMSGYHLVKLALDHSVVQNPRFAAKEGSAVHIGGTLFSTIASLAKVEGFTGGNATGAVDILAGSLSHISPALQKALNEVVDLAKIALESAKRSRAQLGQFADSVTHIENALWRAPKLKMIPSAAVEAIKTAAIEGRLLLISMLETVKSSHAAFDKGATAMTGLQDSPAAHKMREMSDMLSAAEQSLTAIRDMSTLTLATESLATFRGASWYPQLISDLDARAPGSGQSLDLLLSRLMLVANVADQGTRVISGIYNVAGGITHVATQMANVALPVPMALGTVLGAAATLVNQRGGDFLSSTTSAVGTMMARAYGYLDWASRPV